MEAKIGMEAPPASGTPRAAGAAPGKERARAEQDTIVVVGASEHNLRNVNITLPRDALCVFTGVSGSGKSSLAFDTLFKEGQRRFLESLSPYARQFLGQMEKPRVEHVEGLSPTISIDQKTVNRNPRSTVGTLTELYDHYRLLFARLGQPHCPACQVPIASLTPQQMADRLLEQQAAQGHVAPTAPGEEPQGPPCIVYAPMIRERKGEYRQELQQWREQGYARVRVDGQVRRLEEDIPLARYKKHTLELVLDRFRLHPDNRPRLTEALEMALRLTGGLVLLDIGGQERTFSGNRTCPQCGRYTVPELEPRLFSFNDPQGACPACHGLGVQQQYTEERLTRPERSLEDGCLTCFTERGNLVFTDLDRDMLVAIARALRIPTRKPWGQLSPEQRHLLLHGNVEQELRARTVFHYPHKLQEQAEREGTWPGLLDLLRTLERYRETSPCPDCQGKRLNPVALAVRFHGMTVDVLAGLTVEESLAFFAGLQPSAREQAIGKDIFREIRSRLGFLNDVGVGYLALNRAATTLSGGEAQRIRLASQVGSGLQGVLYILDEPSIGLHQTDNRKLIQTLQRLRDVGNTVYVVEHDQETIEAADHVVDLGPGAGGQGGRVLAQGRVEDLVACEESLSGQYLGGSLAIPIPRERRPPGKEALTLHGCRRHNLDNVTVRIPLGMLVAITGVSGSGKSTLVHDILKRAVTAHLSREALPLERVRRISGLEHLDKVIEIDQSPIGRTPRSNPATYTKVFDQIRALFAELPEAKMRGYAPGRFSFNVKGGRCEACEGAGVRTIEMQFLSDVEVECEDCQGKRFNDETLQIQYKGRDIHQVLDMPVDEAAGFFTNVPGIAHILRTLQEVGLGYVRLGQPSTTLSGGEAQRMKLASELRKRATGRTLYLLDEPTTGLHFHDIRGLLECLDALVNQGNSVLVIEHNLDVIKVADHVIDLGPGGGKHGGKIIGEGTPEELAAQPDSLTGRVLKPLLTPRRHPAHGGGAHGAGAHGAGGNGAAGTGAAGGSASGNGAAGNGAAGQGPGSKGLGRSARDLRVRGAEMHNLKHVDVTIPRNQFTVITGVSGSGKTSLALDTLFAEGQARYVESLSTYARRFLGRMDKARVDSVEGLAPAIAIDQNNSSRSPRSTVATSTEIYDYLRLLYARVGVPHCPECGQPLLGYTPTRLARELVERHEGERVLVLAPLYRPGAQHPALLDAPAHLAQVAAELVAGGHSRVRVGGHMLDLQEWLALPEKKRKLAEGPIDLVMDRVRISVPERKRLAEALEAAYAQGRGLARLVFADHAGDAPAPEHPQPERLVSEKPGCVDHDVYLLEPLTPRAFSFNSHVGACAECAGLGTLPQVDPARLVPFPEHPLLEGALVASPLGQTLARKGGKAERALAAFARQQGIPLGRPFGKLTPEQQALLLHGDGRRLTFTQRGFGSHHRVRSTTFRGLCGLVLELYQGRDERWTEWIDPVLAEAPCPACGGERLQPLVRAVSLGGLNISQFCAFTVQEALAAVQGWALNKTQLQVAEQPLQEIRSRLGFLVDVGLGYLSLNRESMTLSGGEAQRIRLASQLGSHLVGVLY
ncbi:MAG TPA: excinuclease ABC subunit UvrA, partial [bacterium]|nr:excinuclease ABC subunit UvrA [bacterium]